MKIAGEATLVAPVEKVWAALLDPAVLVATIPGCDRLAQTGEHAYDMTVTAGVAAIRGTYTGTCELSDLQEHESLVLRARGAGAPGTIDATVQVRLEANDDGTTTLTYDADAVVGGMVGGVGQRMLTSVSRRMATEFFSNVERAINGHAAHEEPVGPPAVEPAETPQGVYQRPAAAAGTAGVSQDFLTGIAVGAGLVLLGVVAGRWSRR